MSKVLLVLLFGLVWSYPARAFIDGERLGWKDYRNERFGLVMRYPAGVFASHRSSASGDGDLFETTDGKARLLVGALANTEYFKYRLIPGLYCKAILSRVEGRLCPCRGTWTVLSGTIDETMIYEKAMFSCGGELISTFAMTYPVAERGFYDRLVEGVERTSGRARKDAIKMARLSELPRKPPARLQSKRWLWLVLLGAGFVVGHYFNRTDGEKKELLPPASYRINQPSLAVSAPQERG